MQVPEPEPKVEIMPLYIFSEFVNWEEGYYSSTPQTWDCTDFPASGYLQLVNIRALPGYGFGMATEHIPSGDLYCYQDTNYLSARFTPAISETDMYYKFSEFEGSADFEIGTFNGHPYSWTGNVEILYQGERVCLLKNLTISRE